MITVRKPGYSRGGSQQRGFSMVELSIALMLALFLIGGLLAIEQGTRRTFGNQNVMAQLQDNERLAMTLINDVVQAAGYFPDPVSYTQQLALPIALPTFTQAGQALSGTRGVGAPGDTITARFVTATNNDLINCTGNTFAGVSTAFVYTNVFAVSGGQLTCSINGAAAVPLVNNVYDMQIWYGINSTGSSLNVDSYLRADAMTAPNWINVSSVMVRLRFNNPLWGQAGQLQYLSFTRVIAVMNRTGV